VPQILVVLLEKAVESQTVVMEVAADLQIVERWV